MSEQKVYGFNDTIEIPENEYVLLPEGQYEFTVVGTERSYYSNNGNQNSKVPNNTPLVKITMSVETEAGKATIYDRFYLYQGASWRIGAFHKCIGLLPEDAKNGAMNWDAAIGKKGVFTIKHTQGNSENITFMNVDKYVLPSKVKKEEPQQPTSQYNGLL